MTGTTDVAELLTGLGASALAVTTLLAATMAWGRRAANHSVVDSVWGPGFALVAVVCLSIGWLIHGPHLRAGLVATLTVVWGGRLGAHIHRRNRLRYGPAGDPRYRALLAKAPERQTAFLLRRIYLPQGVLMWVVSLPVQVTIAQVSGSALALWGGAALWLVGFGFEAIGDAQLSRFTADPGNAGQLMDRGLWAWTRHPNYFGDACVWTGLWVAACGTWWGVATVISPVLMTYFLVARSGKALLERRMARARGPAFAAYVERTSGFFPLPPRRVARDAGRLS